MRLLILLTLIVTSSCGLFRKKEHGPVVKREKTPAKVRKLLKVAESYKGTPYKYGGTSRKGMDCSGFVMTCYKEIGINLPRRSIDQARMGKPVPLKKAKPGDLVAFKIGGKVSHVGIVYKVKDGEVYFIHASSSKGITVSSLSESYWKKHFYQIRRIIE